MNNKNCGQRAYPLVYNCYGCTGPTGPTGEIGPTGPAGAATVTVGTTTTGDPGSAANVTNVGTPENVILDFTIPAGATGPTGEIGPTGTTGEIGPTGPRAVIDSILVGFDGTQTVQSNDNLELGVLVNSTGTAFTYTSPNQITINEAGTYLLNFSSIINNTNAAGDLGVSLQVNSTVIPTASEYIVTQTASFSSELQHNYNASPGDVITVINLSPVSNNYHDVTLSILKLI